MKGAVKMKKIFCLFFFVCLMGACTSPSGDIADPEAYIEENYADNTVIAAADTGSGIMYLLDDEEGLVFLEFAQEGDAYQLLTYQEEENPCGYFSFQTPDKNELTLYIDDDENIDSFSCDIAKDEFSFITISEKDIQARGKHIFRYELPQEYQLPNNFRLFDASGEEIPGNLRSLTAFPDERG